MLRVLKNFFQIRFNLWTSILSSILLSVIYIYFILLPDIIIFPNGKDYNFGFYNDKANGGNSEIIKQKVSDSVIEFEFDLKQGFISPYVGISISKKDKSLINLAFYNQFRIDIRGNGINGIGFSLYKPNPYHNKDKGSDEISFYNNLEISSARKQYTIELNQLKIPDWWYSYNNVSPNEKIEPDLKNIQNFNIGTLYTPILTDQSSIQIYSISFARNNKELLLNLLTIEFAVIIFLAIAYYLKAYLYKKAIPVTISYKPVEVENKNQQTENFIEYISLHFHESDLSLEKVSGQTGINQRRIASVIQQSFKCNFKTYLNQIRISESKRLLNESDLNIGEIAYKVGFNNQSHFNRVFKSMEEISPTQFRERKK